MIKTSSSPVQKILNFDTKKEGIIVIFKEKLFDLSEILG